MATGQLNGVIRQLCRLTLLTERGTMTDGQLLECFVTGQDDAAFEALVRRHGPMVLGVCRRVLHHAQDAEDAFQAAFYVLARKAASIKQRELLGNWLYGVAYRAALEVKAARRTRERQMSEMPEPLVVPEADVWSELRPILDEAALDLLYNSVDEMMRQGEFARLDALLANLDVASRSVDLLLGLLTAATGAFLFGPTRHGLTCATFVPVGPVSNRPRSVFLRLLGRLETGPTGCNESTAVLYRAMLGYRSFVDFFRRACVDNLDANGIHRLLNGPQRKHP